MGRRSSITENTDVRAAVDAALARGATVDDILLAVQRVNPDISRSAVGRYAKNYRELANRERDVRAVAKAYAADFGGSDNPTGKLLIQLITSMAAKSVMAQNEEDGFLDPKDLHYYARAAKDIVSSAKIDTDRDALVRKEERDRAIHIVRESGHAAGVAKEQLELITKQLLGIA